MAFGRCRFLAVALEAEVFPVYVRSRGADKDLRSLSLDDRTICAYPLLFSSTYLETGLDLASAQHEIPLTEWQGALRYLP